MLSFIFDHLVTDNISLTIFSSYTKGIGNGRPVDAIGLALPPTSGGRSGIDHNEPSHLHEVDGVAVHSHSLWR